MRTALNTPFGVGAEPHPGHKDGHTVTTNFPTWNHVQRFVDRDPEIMNGFTNMYPRVMRQKGVLQVRPQPFMVTDHEMLKSTSSLRHLLRKRVYLDRPV